MAVNEAEEPKQVTRSRLDGGVERTAIVADHSKLARLDQPQRLARYFSLDHDRADRHLLQLPEALQGAGLVRRSGSHSNTTFVLERLCLVRSSIHPTAERLVVQHVLANFAVISTSDDIDSPLPIPYDGHPFRGHSPVMLAARYPIVGT